MRVFSQILALCSLFLLSCQPQPKELKPGTWRGVIELQGQELPFTFRVSNDSGRISAFLQNAGEEILLDEIAIKGDSVDMVLHIFDASLKAKIEGEKLVGTFYKNYAPEANLPFTASYGNSYRFASDGPAPATDYNGTYQVVFQTEKETYPAVGIFEQKNNHVQGTFLVSNGDYRYLEGNVVGDTLLLSTFDGNHAFIFKAVKQGDSIKGDFYSGKSSHETWTGIKNDEAKLPDAEALTYLKPGFEKLEFSFPDLNGQKVSLSDARFQNKVVILQIFGTWCPNCMDETKFLAPWYRQNNARGVEILGLAYERKDDFNYAKSRIEKMKAKLDVPYDFVVAGVNDKDKASESLPALSKVLAFPTTIFVGKDGKVKYIHTGFEGPGTGAHYERFKQRFNEIVNELIKNSDKN